MSLLLAAAALVNCSVTDGDTLRCGQERVRLIGIDAPELPGHCRHDRDCARGDARGSKAALERLIAGQAVVLERHGADRYGRTLAFARVGRVDLSCAQLRRGFAIYKAEWDVRGRLRRCKR